MRLFLTSLGVGDHPHLLIDVIGAGATVGVVLNAIDDRPVTDQELAWEIERDELLRLHLRPERLDLRLCADVERVQTIDALWVRGGNTFVLRAAMATAAADAVITRRILDSSLGYAGYSAGAAVLAPDLHVIAGVDDPGAAGPDPLMTGLGVLDRPLIPHVGSTSYAEGRECTALNLRLTADGIDHYAVSDRDALVADSRGLRSVSRPG